jgi:hypothetical protein
VNLWNVHGFGFYVVFCFCYYAKKTSKEAPIESQTTTKLQCHSLIWSSLRVSLVVAFVFNDGTILQRFLCSCKAKKTVRMQGIEAQSIAVKTF